MEFAKNLLPRMHMREGVKQLVLSVCQFVNLSVCQSGKKFLNLDFQNWQ